MGLNLIPLVALCVSSVFSIAALIISYLSYRNSKLARRSSEEAQNHSQIVEFEQRRTELKLFIHRTKILIIEISNNEFYRELRDTKNMQALEDSLRRMETILPRYYQTPPTPSTEDRLTLEQMRASAMELESSVQELKLIAQRVEDAKRSTPKGHL